MSDIKKKIGEFIDDMTSLEVATFTNKSDDESENTNLDLSGENADTEMKDKEGQEGDKESNADRKFKAKTIFKEIRQQLADKKLVGYSRFDIDGDTISYINNEEDTEELREYHISMIEKGEQARKNLFDTAVSLFKKS